MNLLNKVSEVKQKVSGAGQQLSFVRAYFSLVEDPNDTVRVFKLQDKMLRATSSETRQAIIDFIKQDPAVAQCIEQRYVAPDYKVADLAQCQPGTLGYAYYRHMSDNGFTPDFFPAVKLDDELGYFELRMRQTHDIWHVVAGYSPSVEDEIGLQTFYAAQMPGPMFNAVLVSAGLLHGVTRNQKLIKPILNAISKGWEQGIAVRHMQAAKWEEMWNRSLEEIRQEYKVKPAHDLYDFSPTQERELAAV